MQVLTKSMKVLRNPALIAAKLDGYRQERTKANLDLAAERVRSIEFLSRHFGVDAAALLDEYRTSAFKTWYDARKHQLSLDYGTRQVSSDFDLETMYLLVSAAQPDTIVETGVLFGASSAHILTALEENGRGQLVSVDLDRSAAEPPHDYFVPPALQRSWRLVIGDSRVRLPEVLEELGEVDIFHHDSLHTYDHMMWEYETAFPYLSDRGIISSHDVVVRSLRGRGPFHDFASRHGLDYGIFRNVGITAPAERA